MRCGKRHGVGIDANTQFVDAPAQIACLADVGQHRRAFQMDAIDPRRTRQGIVAWGQLCQTLCPTKRKAGRPDAMRAHPINDGARIEAWCVNCQECLLSQREPTSRDAGWLEEQNETELTVHASPRAG